MKKTKIETEEDIFKALKQIKPCDLTDENTTIEDAVEFCKDIMMVFVEAAELDLPPPNQLRLVDTLKQLGACTYDNAAGQFKTDGKTLQIKAPNNVEFPLSFFSQIIGTTSRSYRYGYLKATDGGEKYSWASEWIQAQPGNTKSRASDDEAEQSKLGDKPELKFEPQSNEQGRV